MATKLKYGVTCSTTLFPQSKYILGLCEYSEYSKNHWLPRHGVGYALEPQRWFVSPGNSLHSTRQEILTTEGNVFGEQLYIICK